MSDSRPGMAPEARTAAGSIRGLAALPDDARLWIFGASRPLGEQDAALLISSTQRSLEEWAAHGRPLAIILAEVGTRAEYQTGVLSYVRLRYRRRLHWPRPSDRKDILGVAS